MRFLMIDSTADILSALTVAFLREQGHQVEIRRTFIADIAHTFDAVWTEHCCAEAVAASRSGLCRRLVIRVRRDDDDMESVDWTRVHALVYENATLKAFVQNRVPSTVQAVVCPVGVDMQRLPFAMRYPGPVFAAVADVATFSTCTRFASQQPDIMLHVLLKHWLTDMQRVSLLPNMVAHEGAVVAKTLQTINTNFLFVPAVSRQLQYEIAEAMALGITPLIADVNGMVARHDWPNELFWTDQRDFSDLVRLAAPSGELYDSWVWRAWVADHYDARKRSPQFAALLTA